MKEFAKCEKYCQVFYISMRNNKQWRETLPALLGTALLAYPFGLGYRTALNSLAGSKFDLCAGQTSF